MKLVCSICAVAFSQTAQLAVHLQSLHAHSAYDAQTMAVNIETDAIAIELNKNANKQMQQLDIEQTIIPFVSLPITEVQTSVTPFQ